MLRLIFRKKKGCKIVFGVISCDLKSPHTVEPWFTSKSLTLVVRRRWWWTRTSLWAIPLGGVSEFSLSPPVLLGTRVLLEGGEPWTGPVCARLREPRDKRHCSREWRKGKGDTSDDGDTCTSTCVCLRQEMSRSVT